MHYVQRRCENRAASGIITALCVCVCVCQTETRSRAGKIHPQRKNRLTAAIPAAFERFLLSAHTLYSLSIYIYIHMYCDWEQPRRPSRLEVNGLYIPTLPPPSSTFLHQWRSVATCQRKKDASSQTLPYCSGLSESPGPVLFQGAWRSLWQ
jgi:hypothetical protein